MNHVIDVQTWIQTFSYPAVLLLLVGAGMGLPVSEDLVMLTGGIVIARSGGHLSLMMGVAWLGVVTGDFILYSIGRKFGVRALENRFLKKALTKKRVGWVMHHFERWGAATIFVVRFTSGFRVVTYLSAGMSRMHRVKFVVADALGAAIFVPTLVWIGWRFGNAALSHVEHALGWVVLGVIAAVAVAALVIWLRRRRRPRTEELESPEHLQREIERERELIGDRSSHDAVRP